MSQTGAAASRLGNFFPFTPRGLRPGLTSMPPLRGWFDCSKFTLFHFKIVAVVATQSLKAVPVRRIALNQAFLNPVVSAPTVTIEVQAVRLHFSLS